MAAHRSKIAQAVLALYPDMMEAYTEKLIPCATSADLSWFVSILSRLPEPQQGDVARHLANQMAAVGDLPTLWRTLDALRSIRKTDWYFSAQALLQALAQIGGPADRERLVDVYYHTDTYQGAGLAPYLLNWTLRDAVAQAIKGKPPTFTPSHAPLPEYLASAPRKLQQAWRYARGISPQRHISTPTDRPFDPGPLLLGTGIPDPDTLLNEPVARAIALIRSHRYAEAVVAWWSTRPFVMSDGTTPLEALRRWSGVDLERWSIGRLLDGQPTIRPNLLDPASRDTVIRDLISIQRFVPLSGWRWTERGWSMLMDPADYPGLVASFIEPGPTAEGSHWGQTFGSAQQQKELLAILIDRAGRSTSALGDQALFELCRLRIPETRSIIERWAGDDAPLPIRPWAQSALADMGSAAR